MKSTILFLSAVLLGVATSTPVSSDAEEKVVGVYGGKRVWIEDANYIADIEFDYYVSWAGAILDNKWILTTAASLNNVRKERVHIHVGRELRKEGRQYEVEEYYIHPEFNGEKVNDIALIKLKQPLTFSTETQSISIASSLPEDGTAVTVSGYGQSVAEPLKGHLNQASLPFLSSSSCKSQVKDIKYSCFCTQKDKAGPCDGDSGAPLVYNNELIGLYTWSFYCGYAGYPSVYTDVTQYRDWITKTMERHS